ncbi:MAG TPA: HAD family hydrolase [Caldilineae bacterium]|nr:HAD family hydrolase [Caldilineae bacterium]
MPLRAVTFDFWGTLYQVHTGGTSIEQRSAILIRYLAAHGYRISPDRVRAAMEASFQRAYEIWSRETRTADAAERVAWILEELRVSLPEDECRRMIREMEETLLQEPVEPIPGAVEVVRSLAGRYRLGLISDTGMSPGRVLRQFMAREGILELFHHCTFSDETGRAKPHERQFLDTLERLGVHPQEAVHIGDLTATDILGARRVGMRAVLFTGVTYGQDPSLADAVITSYEELPPILEAWDNS